VIGAGEKTKKIKTTFIKPPLIGRGCQPLSGLPKAFHWYGLDTLFFFVSLCVPLWLKLDGGFCIRQGLLKS
jgi:hypothetical protein